MITSAITRGLSMTRQHDIPSSSLPDVCTEGREEEQQAHVKVLDNMWQLRVPEGLEAAHQARDAAVHATQPLNGTAVVDQIAETFLCFNHHCKEENHGLKAILPILFILGFPACFLCPLSPFQ